MSYILRLYSTYLYFYDLLKSIYNFFSIIYGSFSNDAWHSNSSRWPLAIHLLLNSSCSAAAHVVYFFFAFIHFDYLIFIFLLVPTIKGEVNRPPTFPLALVVTMRRRCWRCFGNYLPRQPWELKTSFTRAKEDMLQTPRILLFFFSSTPCL